MTERKLKVAHLITNFTPGGAQDYLFMIVRSLDQSKFQPIVAGRMEGEWTDQAQSIPGVEAFDIRSLRRDITPWHDFLAVFEIWRFCRTQRIDVLHTHSSKPGVVGRLGGWLAGVPCIVHTIHGFSFHDFMPRWRRRLYILLERSMSYFTTILLLYSEGNKRTAKQLRIEAKSSVETFYYGINPAPFATPVDRPSVRAMFGFGPGNVVIGFTGRFSEQKALHILISAFAEIVAAYPHARLLLVGSGPLQRRLEDQALHLGVLDKVVFTGFRSDVAAVLAAMDLFVMTSLWEGLSRSLAEAMYARLPVIATDVGGTSDAVRNGETGWLIPANNVPATRDALLAALGDPECAKRYGEAGYRWAMAAFDPRRMQNRLESLYIDAVMRH